MIIKVFKYLVVGLSPHLEIFLERAQAAGFMEFVSFREKKGLVFPDEVKTFHQAIKILRKLPVKKEIDEKLDNNAIYEMAKRIIELRGQIEDFYEQLRLAEAETSRILPLGDFSLEDIHYIEKNGKRVIQFFCKNALHELPKEAVGRLFYITTEYDLNYYLSISPEKVYFPDMIEMKVDKSLSQLRHHLLFLKESIHLLEAELKGYGGYFLHMQEALLEYLDEHALTDVKKQISFPLNNALFAIEAWIPENKLESLNHLLLDLDIWIEKVAVDEGEQVPTYMENKGHALIGEDLVKIYDIPSPEDKDPSSWVLWSFALFFAMIVCDAGYGLIYLLIGLWLKKKAKAAKAPKKNTLRMIRLLKILGIASILWGTATLSFFGIPFEFKSPFQKMSVLHHLAERKADYHLQKKDAVFQEIQKDFGLNTVSIHTGEELLDAAVLMDKGVAKHEIYDEFIDSALLEISLLIGLIHVCISLLRYSRKSLANLGWIIFAIGGYLYFPSQIDATSMVVYLGIMNASLAFGFGYQMIFIGIGFAVIMSVIQQKLKGLRELEKVVSVFADVLSYLRLYALALASSMMAETFNDIAIHMLGLAFGGIALIVGHGANFILCTMGGMIHGLRLNFIEWYHYCFDGGGRLLNPLRRLKN